MVKVHLRDGAQSPEHPAGGLSTAEAQVLKERPSGAGNGPGPGSPGGLCSGKLAGATHPVRAAPGPGCAPSDRRYGQDQLEAV